MNVLFFKEQRLSWQVPHVVLEIVFFLAVPFFSF